MKKAKKYLLLILFFTVSFFIYKVITFRLFDNELVLIEKLPVIQADYSVLLYRFPSSATVDGSIQVHLIQDNSGDSKFYKNYDGFNKIVLAKVLRENVLLLELQDTLHHNKIDTMHLNLPNKY